MNSKEWLTQLSQLTGLPYYEQHKVFEDKAGTLIGERDGYLVTLGLGTAGNNNSAVKMLLRYGKAENSTAQVKDGLQGILGKFGQLVVEETTATAARGYTFGKPEPKEISDIMVNVLGALKSSAPAFTGRCEHCQRTENQITLFNNVPSYVCSSCQQKIAHDLNTAGAAYEQLETNFPQGLLFGIGAAIAGGLAWGLVAYAMNYIFLWGAIGIGFLVGKGVVHGMGKVTWPGRILIGVLTVASILFGDVLFYTLSVMHAENLPFSMGLVMDIVTHFWEIETSAKGGLLSLAFALIGAGIVVYSTRKPEFQAQFEPLGSSTPTAN